ncbi:MAG: methionyl-tRNA synthetase [Cirrosporium novae-zelandiae]|nr:MAG: methionyl-tRNA synthetase [Cirrosporium novae-zelandiae]
MVLTDVLKRWQTLQGNRAILITGTDEHGMKIQRAASDAGIDTKAFCDTTCKDFKILADRAGIEYNRFIRTTDADHKEAVEFFWRMLNKRGYIYESKHEGWYSISDETFYPESAVQLTQDPPTGRKMMTSRESGKEVEWTSEVNYHFRLSAFKDRLLEYYRNNPGFITPKTRMNEVIQSVNENLEDLSISRPIGRLTWGVRVPDDDSQTIYVWLDALINYLTAAGYPFTPGEENKFGWPANCQVIGKDITRFHCVYWPAFLMALDLPLPHQVLTHAHWTLDHKKMSKSIGNVVNPFFALDRFGQDIMRYYLAHDGGIVDDADYENSYIVEKYKKGLQNGLGNLTSRILRGKGWDVRRAVKSMASIDPSAFNGFSETQRTLLQELPEKVKEKLDALDVGGALKEIMEMIYTTNKFMQDTSPWSLAKGTGKGPWFRSILRPEDLVTTLQVDEIIYFCAEALRICGILLQPYMPSKASQLLDMLGVNQEQRTFADTKLRGDIVYGTSRSPLGNGIEGVLFPPLICED